MRGGRDASVGDTDGFAGGAGGASCGATDGGASFVAKAGCSGVAFKKADVVDIASVVNDSAGCTVGLVPVGKQSVSVEVITAQISPALQMPCVSGVVQVR